MRHIIKIQKNLLFFLFLAQVCSGVYGGIQKPAGIECRLENAAGYQMEPAVPVLDIPRLTMPPKIDGAIGENEWSGSASIDNLLVPVTTSNAVPATKCRLGFDDNALYLAFRCNLAAGIAPQAKAKTRDAPAWDDDSIELFIWPDGSKSSYDQLVVNSIGTRFDQKCTFDPISYKQAGKDDLAWNPQWEAVTSREKDDTWTLEIAIPWKSLDIEPKGIKGIRFNICRNVVPGPSRYSSWAWLPKIDFQMFDRFGIGICYFDPAKRQIDNVAELGLGMAGMFSAETINAGNGMVTSKKTEVVCAALPSHPLFSGQKCRLIIDGRLLDRWGEQQPGSEFEIDNFELPSSVPHKLVVTSSGRENYLLNLRMGMGNVTNFQRSLAVIPVTWSEISERFHKADLPALAQKEPFKAAGYLGAAGCMEKLRSSASLADMFRNLREVIARLDVLENGKTDITPDSLLHLLNLAGHPEAQVVIEYPSYRKHTHPGNTAEITYYWGSIPLGTVWYTQLTPDNTNAWFTSKKDLCVFEGNTARITTNFYGWSSFCLKDYDPLRHVLFIKKFKKGNRPLVLNIEDIDFSSLENIFGHESLKVTITSLPGCPSNVAETAKTLASKEGLISLPFEEAMKGDAVLVTGDARQVAGKLGISKQNVNILFKQAKPSVSFEVVRGREVFTIWSAPTRTFAEMALRLAMAGKPVLPSEVDAMRLEIVKAMAPETKQCSTPGGQHLFCGDVHMHTTFSDGATSPLATALETMYCFMDFAVMSDHNTIESAVQTRKLLDKNGFSYPLIVGEEITTKWAHLNAYPLREVVLPTLTPSKTIKAAHRQGAVVQWNHPGFTDSDFEMSHLMTGIAGTGCDAWEHTFRLYDTWKTSGKLPVMVGATDTHSGTFGWPERTLILAPAPEGNDLAKAIRRAKVVMVSQDGGNFFYGSDEMLKYAWSALKEGTVLKAEKAERLKNTLKNADIIGLILKTPDKNQR